MSTPQGAGSGPEELTCRALGSRPTDAGRTARVMHKSCSPSSPLGESPTSDPDRVSLEPQRIETEGGQLSLGSRWGCGLPRVHHSPHCLWGMRSHPSVSRGKTRSEILRKRGLRGRRENEMPRVCTAVSHGATLKKDVHPCLWTWRGVPDQLWRGQSYRLSLCHIEQYADAHMCRIHIMWHRDTYWHLLRAQSVWGIPSA